MRISRLWLTDFRGYVFAHLMETGIVKPGSDLYFVYNHNWIDDPLQNRLYTLDRRASRSAHSSRTAASSCRRR